jgi:hypothetical protein
MATDHKNSSGADDDGAKPAQQQQQPQSSGSEGHGGQGSESVMKQMRAWEQRRATNSGRRSGSH